MDEQERVTIIADGSPLQGDFRERGIARYTRDLLNAVTSRDDVQLFVRTLPYLRPINYSDQLAQFSRSDVEIASLLQATAAPSKSVYLLTSPFQSEPSSMDVIPRWATQFRVPVIGTVYDVIPALLPEIYLPDRITRRNYFGRMSLLRTADYFVSISNSAREDFCRLTGVSSHSVTSIGTGVDLSFFSIEAAREAQRLESGWLRELNPKGATVVLYVAGQDKRKNVAGLLRTWRRLSRELRAKLKLIVACSAPPSVMEDWQRIARANTLLPEEYAFTGGISDRQLLALYSAAELQIFASLYEGFGLPIAEAAACGLVSIHGDNSSLPEVLGTEFARFDATDDFSMANAIEEAFGKESCLHSLRNRIGELRTGLGWDSVANRFIEVVHQIARKPTKIIAPITPCRIAFGSSVLTEGSYEHGLVSSLTDHFEVSLLLPGSAGNEGVLGDLSEAGLKLLPIQSVGRLLPVHDNSSTLVLLRDSKDCIDELDLLHRCPASVILEDLYLLSLFREFVLRYGPNVFGLENRKVLRNNLSDPTELLEIGVLPLETCFGMVNSFIVPTQRMRQTLIRGLRSRRTFVEVIPAVCKPKSFTLDFSERFAGIQVISNRAELSFPSNTRVARSEVASVAVSDARVVWIDPYLTDGEIARIERSCLEEATPIASSFKDALEICTEDEILWTTRSREVLAEAHNRSSNEIARKILLHLTQSQAVGISPRT